MPSNFSKKRKFAQVVVAVGGVFALWTVFASEAHAQRTGCAASSARTYALGGGEVGGADVKSDDQTTCTLPPGTGDALRSELHSFVSADAPFYSSDLQAVAISTQLAQSAMTGEISSRGVSALTHAFSSKTFSVFTYSAGPGLPRDTEQYPRRPSGILLERHVR